MREITEQIFRVTELNEKALEKAHSDWQERQYYFGSENESTLNKFIEQFDLELNNYNYDGCGGSVDWDFKLDEEIENLSGIRLLTYLHNNYFNILFKGKYYYKNRKHRHAKTILDNCCTLTGYYMDNEILNPIYDFMKKPKKETTFHDLINECMESWIEACNTDYNFYYSEEYFIEESEANECEYYEDGTLYN